MPPLDLAALRGRLPPSPITRFAPSPTGFLHLGHVANAIYVWGVARALGVVLEPGAETFTDAMMGVATQAPSEQCGDLLLRDRTGNWTYQFAVVVDDQRHEVDLVVRGEDLWSSTGRQIRLSRMLGRARPPVFFHHPLIRRADGAKLSKSSGDTGIGELRRAGVSAERVLGRAAWLTGLLDRPRDVGAEDLESLF